MASATQPSPSPRRSRFPWLRTVRARVIAAVLALTALALTIAGFTAYSLETAKAETIGGKAKGDRLALLLDAVPEKNRLALTLDVNAPARGVLAALGGFKEPLTAKLAGRGDWTRWDGRFDATLGAAPLAGLALSARDGTFAA